MYSNVANQFFDYAVNARASYSPDAMNSGSAPAVNGWTAVKVDAFRQTSPDFSAQMYTDGHGNFRFSMRGSETSNYAGDFRTADVALMAGKWDSQLADGIRFVGEAILQIKATPSGEKMSLDDIRAILDGSGHSLGGAIYEAAASFWGLRGMNIDGPGVAKQIASPEFQAIKDEFRARGLSDLQDSYEWQEGDFQARRYTIVGAAEVHADGVNVYTSPKMDALLTDIDNTPAWAVAAGAGHKFAWELVGSVAGHPMAAIFKLEGMGDVDVRLLQLERQRNVEAGLSANGYEVDTTHYEPTRSGQGIVQVTTYKDPITGAIMEVRLPGTQVDGQFVASGTPPLVIGMDSAGRTVLTGAAAQEIAAAQLGSNGGSTSTADLDPNGTTVTAKDPWSDYSTVSIQNHGDGTTSFTFQGENGDTAWVLPNGEGGRVVVLTQPNAAEGEPQTITYDLDASGHRVGPPRYYNGDGVEVSETGVPVGEPPPAQPDPFHDALVDAFENPQVPAGGGTQVADAGGDGMWTDGGPQIGGGVSVPISPGTFDGYLRGAGAGLTPGQKIALEHALAGLNLGGIDELGFVTLPGGGTTYIINVDGEIVGELYTDDSGASRISSHRILPDGSVRAVDDYVLPSGKVLTAQQYEDMQVNNAASALGLMNSIIGLQNWDAMSDLQRVAVLTSIYNTFDVLSGGEALPGNLGTAAGVLGLLNALDQGNLGAAMISGIAVINGVFDNAASNAIGEALNIPPGNVIPVLNLILALDSGDPVQIASAALAFLGPWGVFAGAVLSIVSSLFQDDQPMSEGAAHAQWDAEGNLQIVTTQDEHGGGPTAEGWMSALAHGLQDELARNTDANGAPLYGLVPQLLPTIGFMHDPDGFNYHGEGTAQGHMFLSWVDENGLTQTRYYDGAGNRNDGSGETLAGDFMQLAMAAIAPAWAVQTTLAHWQAGQGLHLPTEKASLPQESEDGLTQTLQVLTLAVPGFEAPRESLIDIDGDGYLEATQWVQANQAMLAIDANGDGFIGAGELLHMQGGNSFNSLQWLDANGDGKLDASDPAWPALRLWMDVNGDGISRNGSGDEAIALVMYGIEAIDFTSDPPCVVYSHGRTHELTAQMLTGDTLGVAYQLTEGGVLEITERADGSGEAVLIAANTREFDGQDDHIHGGLEDTGEATDGVERAPVTIDEDSGEVVTTTTNTVTRGDYRSQQTSTEVAAGDTRLADGEAGTVIAGQEDSERVADTPVFVPLDAATGSGEPGTAEQPPARGTGAKQATDAMVRSAEPPVGGGLDLTSLVGIAIGAGAAQWPTVVSAEEPAPADPAAGAAGEPGLVQPAAPAQPEVVNEAPSPIVAPMFIRDTQPGDAEEGTPVSAPDADASEAGHTAQAEPAFTGTLPGGDAAATASEPESGLDPMPGIDEPPPGYWHPPKPPVLDYPSVSGEHASGPEDTVLRFTEASLLANDSTRNSAAFPDQPILRITSVFAPVHGSVSLQTNAQGHIEVVFVPEPNYHGGASFGYTVTDQYGLSSSGTVTLDIAPVNDAPVTQSELASGDEDHALLFTAASLLANDSDVDTAVDGDVLRITRVGAAEHGQVFLEPDGTVRFVPDANYNGPTRFTYWVGDRDVAAIASGEGHEVPSTVNLTILPVNDLPVVQGEIIDSDEDIVLEIDPALLLANDTDVDTDPFNQGNAAPPQVLTITAVGGAQHGTIELLPDGRLRFVPEKDYFGPAGFSYTVDDGHGGRVQGQVVVNLAPVNDAPVAQADVFDSNEDEVVTLAQALLLANDSDVDSPHADLVIVAVDNATHGTVSLAADGSIRFVPEADYFGVAQFTYTVSDGVGGFTVGTANLNIAPVNDAPRLVGERLTVDEDTQVRFTTDALLANDHDVDNPHADLRITGVGDATNGSVRLVNGEIVFTPRLNFFGEASFSYTVDDGVGGTSQATVAINFNPVNDAPVVNGELIWGKRNITYTLTPAALLANDTDVESPQDLRITEIANVQHGTATLHTDGRVTFVPEPGYAGRGSFDYWVEDPEGARSMATAEIDFSRINQTPVATDDSFVGYEDVPFVISAAQLLVNDTDDGDPTLANMGMRVTAVADAANGTVSVDASGNVTFVPRADFYGTASFRYQVTDPEGASTWAQAVLTVQSVNDAPIIEDIWYGRPVYGYQLTSTYHWDNGWTHTYSVVTDAAAAQAVVASGGALYRATPVQVRNSDGDLVTETQYSAISPTYYRNGQMRPIEIDTTDATVWGSQYEGGFELLPWDDPYRLNGGIVAYDPDGNSSAITFSLGSTPQHGHAWVNMFTSDSASGMIPYTEAAPYWVGSSGAWQYYSHGGDTYSGADPFTIRVTDGQGASTTVTIGATHVGSSPAGGGCPIVIDLDNNGIDLIRPEDSNVFMDINGDGWKDRIGWAAPSDAILVLDANGDGRVDIDQEVSFVDHLPGARTDLEGLAAHDSNGDGWISAADARWKEFGLFQDRNGNGMQDEGEFVSLDEAGVRGIALTREGTPEMNQGNVVFGTSQVQWADGGTTRAGDVMFAGEGVPLPDAARLALLFAQYAALPPQHASDASTVFVSVAPEETTDAWLAAAAAANAVSVGAGVAV